MIPGESLRFLKYAAPPDPGTADSVTGNWRRVPAGLVPVTSDLDVYRAAHLLIKRHGDDAPIEAAMRADELAADGDMEGRAVWLRIVKAIEELQSQERPAGAEVH